MNSGDTADELSSHFVDDSRRVVKYGRSHELEEGAREYDICGCSHTQGFSQQ